MENLQRTIYAAHAATCKALMKPWTILPNSTLNQKWNLADSETPAVNQYPTLGYIGIGNRGASYEITTDNFALSVPTPHLARHASAYNFIPFVIREITDDLSATERARYRLRVPRVINGVNYVVYYLRVLDLTTVSPSVELRTVNNGTISTTGFSPELSDLSPTAPVLSNTNVNNPNGSYLISTAKVNFTLSQEDINEIMNACDIIYGDPRYAVINEIMVCHGVDKVIQGNFGATTGAYTELIGAQVAAFLQETHALTSSSVSVSIDLDIGGVEPMQASS